MDSTLKPVETDGPSDVPAIAPDIPPTARADITSDAKSHASNRTPGPEASGAPAPAIDATFRAAAVGSVQAPRDRPKAAKWVTRAIMSFVFALCSGIAAAAWQHYGDAAKQMASNWPPRFALASSPPPEQTTPVAEPDASAVQASAADQPAHPTASAPPAERTASDTGALSPDSSRLIQSMARDLAAMGQQIEQLKASIADLRVGQQPMARDISKTPGKTSEKIVEAGTPTAKNSAIRTSLLSARQKLSTPPPPLRSAAVQPRRPMPGYPPVQAGAPPTPLAAPPAAPAPPPQVAANPADGPVMRPPLPLH